MEIETGSQAPPVPRERRYLTIVFSDLVGYTQLSEWMDPEDLRELQLRYQRAALTAMENYGGFVASYSGDGILVYFGYPTAHENDAERAVRAALELVSLVTTLKVESDGESHASLSVRIGVNTGLLVIGTEPLSMGRMEYGVVGEAVNLASRLKDEAPVNSVVITRETLELVEGLFDTESLGDWRVKGLSRPVAVHRIVGARPGIGRTAGRIGRGATQMVGRAREKEALLSYWRQAGSEQRCMAVHVVGEAGVGKTRLVQELCEAPEIDGATILRMNCLELFASTPLYAVASLLWQRLGLQPDDDEAARGAKISAFLARFEECAPDDANVLSSLLGFALTRATKAAPIAIKQEQFALVTRLLEQFVANKRALLWIEDAHWLDPSSAELLALIVERLAGMPVLLLVTMRSFPKGPPLPAPDHVIHLEQLQREQCLQLARSVPGAHAVSEDLLIPAVAACDGIPLFIEQLVLSLISQSARPGGVRRFPGNLPLTLAEIMSERLDRLEGGRRVVQAAACVGPSFDAEFVGRLLGDSAGPVIEPLEALVEAEILRRRDDGGRATYEFRHALLQRVAHESIVHADRRAMHARIVDLLKQQSNSELIVPEVLAHHLTQAGRPEEAIRAWLDAAAGASRRSALVEAIAHIRSGLALVPSVRDPQLRRQLELGLQASLIGPLTSTSGVTSDEFSECCARGMELSLAAEPTELIFPFVFGQYTFSIARGLTADATSLSERFLTMADALSHGSARVVGHRLAAMACLHRADLTTARRHVERSLELYLLESDDAATHMFGQNPQVHAKSLLGLTHFLLGDIEHSLQHGLEALRVAEELRHAHSMALALSYLGMTVTLCRAPVALMSIARRLTAISEQHGLRPFLTVGKAFIGTALCQRGDLQQGIVVMEEAIASAEAAKNCLGLAGRLVTLADARRRNGELDSASATSARARQMLANDSKWHEPDALRVDALILRDLDAGVPRVKAGLEQAAGSARKMGLVVAELQCLLDLKSVLGPGRPAPEVDARLAELAAVRDVDRIAEAAVRRHAPGLYQESA